MQNLSGEWIHWIISNLLRGVHPSKLQSVLVNRGMALINAIYIIKSIQHNPAFREGLIYAQHYNKVATLLDIYSSLYKLASVNSEINTVKEINSAEFFTNYFCSNKPLILQGCTEDWPAIKKWSPNFFLQEFGKVAVEITSQREQDPDYELNSYEHKKMILMEDFVRDVISVERTNDFYMVAKNFNLEKPEFRSLIRDIKFLPGIIDKEASLRSRGSIQLWFGPAGTITPLHHDTSNVIFAQIFGRKRFIMIPSFELPKLRNNRGVFSILEENSESWSKDIIKYDVTLQPGEILFIPIGWWHKVVSLDISISVTFQDFIPPFGGVEWNKNYWIGSLPKNMQKRI